MLYFKNVLKRKSDSPNMLDITAAGHLEVGETKEDGIREVKEELGINVPYSNLKYLGIRIEVIDVPYFKNNEFQHVYLLEDNRNLEEYTLQESEVAGLVAIELNEGLKLLDGECSVLQCESVFLENGKKVKKVINVRLEDIIPRLDNYYKKVFIMAERYFQIVNIYQFNILWVVKAMLIILMRHVESEKTLTKVFQQVIIRKH